ncbi:Protein of unknown function [Gryllus bimaculatus]|nr:Protein of unknown function [Gryllus bimaculatus]
MTRFTASPGFRPPPRRDTSRRGPDFPAPLSAPADGGGSFGNGHLGGSDGLATLCGCGIESLFQDADSQQLEPWGTFSSRRRR